MMLGNENFNFSSCSISLTGNFSEKKKDRQYGCLSFSLLRLKAFQGGRAFLIKEGEVNGELNPTRSTSHTVQCNMFLDLSH